MEQVGGGGNLRKPCQHARQHFGKLVGSVQVCKKRSAYCAHAGGGVFGMNGRVQRRRQKMVVHTMSKLHFTHRRTRPTHQLSTCPAMVAGTEKGKRSLTYHAHQRVFVRLPLCYGNGFRNKKSRVWKVGSVRQAFGDGHRVHHLRHPCHPRVAKMVDVHIVLGLQRVWDQDGSSGWHEEGVRCSF